MNIVFASLNLNTGTRLHGELLLLPQNTSTPPSSGEGVQSLDHMNIVLVTDPMQGAPSSGSDATPNSQNSGEEITDNGKWSYTDKIQN
jgi:hypothetical protein